MSLWRRLRQGGFVLTRRAEADRELLDEVEHFFEEQVNELVESGVAPAEARRLTRLRLGEAGSVREVVRAGGWEAVPETVLQDVRYGVRVLRRSPLFSAVAIITLALGVGATTAVFSAVRGVLLRPLPYPDAERLVVPRSRDVTNGDEWTISYADYETWKSAGVFGAVGVYREVEANASGVDAPERVDAVQISDGFLEALGVAPQQGRTFAALDYEPALGSGDGGRVQSAARIAAVALRDGPVRLFADPFVFAPMAPARDQSNSQSPRGPLRRNAANRRSALLRQFRCTEVSAASASLVATAAIIASCSLKVTS